MSLVDLFFPKKCLSCAKGGRYICEACLNKVKRARQICIECERPSIDGMTHTKCKRPWGLDACFSIWVYEGVIRKAFIKLKYKFAFAIRFLLFSGNWDKLYRATTPATAGIRKLNPISVWIYFLLCP